MIDCPICKGIYGTEIQREVLYKRCDNCGAIYATSNIDSYVITENDNTVGRNIKELNFNRIQRCIDNFGNIETLLDYGCGQGYFVRQCLAQGIGATGIDSENQNDIFNYPEAFFNVVSMIEVIEHVINPIALIKQLQTLSNHFYIESTFADNIDNSSTYIDPKIGHRLIHSYKSLSLTFGSNYGMIKLNGNVILMRKE